MVNIKDYIVLKKELIKNEGYRWKRFESEEDTWFYRVEKAISE